MCTGITIHNQSLKMNTEGQEVNITLPAFLFSNIIFLDRYYIMNNDMGENEVNR